MHGLCSCVPHAMTFHELFIEPFTEFSFMRYALASVVFLALSAAPVGVFLVMRRMSLIGDALSHAVLPGAAVGYMVAGLSLPAMGLGGFAAGVLMAFFAGLVSRFTELKEDANFAAFYLSSLAIGVILVSLGGNSVELLHLLFGSVLALDDDTLLLIGAGGGFAVAATDGRGGQLHDCGAGGDVPPADAGKHRPFVFARGEWQGRAVACGIPDFGGDEFGGGLSGAGHADVGRPDDAARHFGTALGGTDGRADGIGGGGRAGVRLCRPAAVVPPSSRPAVRSDHHPVLRHLVCVFRAVRRKQRYFGEIAPQKAFEGLTDNAKAACTHYFTVQAAFFVWVR